MFSKIKAPWLVRSTDEEFSSLFTLPEEFGVIPERLGEARKILPRDSFSDDYKIVGDGLSGRHHPSLTSFF